MEFVMTTWEAYSLVHQGTSICSTKELLITRLTGDVITQEELSQIPPISWLTNIPIPQHSWKSCGGCGGEDEEENKGRDNPNSTYLPQWFARRCPAWQLLLPYCQPFFQWGLASTEREVRSCPPPMLCWWPKLWWRMVQNLEWRRLHARLQRWCLYVFYKLQPCSYCRSPYPLHGWNFPDLYLPVLPGVHDTCFQA